MVSSEKCLASYDRLDIAAKTTRPTAQNQLQTVEDVSTTAVQIDKTYSFNCVASERVCKQVSMVMSRTLIGTYDLSKQPGEDLT